MKIFSAIWPDSFRLRLSILFGGLFLLVSLSDSALEPQQDTRLLQDKGEVLHALARGIAKSIAGQLQERQRELALHAQTPAFSGTWPAPRQQGDVLERIRRANPDYAWLGVVTPDGRVAAASGHPPAAGGLTFSAPLRDDAGRLRGVLSAQMEWSWADKLIADRLPTGTAGEGMRVFIADSANQPLYPGQSRGKTRLPAPLPDPGFKQGDWADGQAYLYAEATLADPRESDANWRVIIRQPPEQALAALNRLRSALTLPDWIATLLLMALVYQLAASLSRPLEELARIAQRIGGGDEAVEWNIRPGARELRQLSLSMRNMTIALLARRRELALANASLEKRVEERTDELREANRQLARKAAQLERLARSDALTGLGNRMAAEERLLEEHRRFHRSGAPYSALLMDADHFKRVNDTYGHAVGDQVLQQIAATLATSVRATDFTARYGGEEFLALLPDTDADGAAVLAEKIRAAMAAADATAAGIVTLSIGVACARGEDATHETIVQRADEALYRAKAQGRNRVERAGD